MKACSLALCIIVVLGCVGERHPSFTVIDPQDGEEAKVVKLAMESLCALAPVRCQRELSWEVTRLGDSNPACYVVSVFPKKYDHRYIHDGGRAVIDGARIFSAWGGSDWGPDDPRLLCGWHPPKP